MRLTIARALTLVAALVGLGSPLRAQIEAPTDTLPTALQIAVRESGCVVPRWPVSSMTTGAVTPGPAMVWRAAVRAPGHVDWVVDCERGHQRTALVFATPVAASSRPVLTLLLPGDPADDYTPSPGVRVTGDCEGQMYIAPPDHVRRAIQQLPKASPLRAKLLRSGATLHAGILDGICESGGSHLRYWTGAEWVTLPDGYSEG